MKKEQNYRDVAKTVMGSDRCAFCFVKARILNVHHINEDRENNQLDNLIVVCSKCHSTLHFRINEAVKKYGISTPRRKKQYQPKVIRKLISSL